MYYILLVLCATPFGISCPPLTLLKYQLILGQLVTVGFLGVLYHLIKSVRKMIIFIVVLIVVFLALITLISPQHALFGNNPNFIEVTTSHSDKVTILGPGFTLWRLLKDLTFLTFIVSALYIVIKKMDEVSFRTVAVLVIGLGVIFLASINDQLFDHGKIQSVYLLPHAIFLFFIILSLFPFIIFTEEAAIHKNLFDQEKRWQQFVGKADVIVVALNRMGHVDSINPYFLNLTGYEPDEVIGKDWFEFFIPPNFNYNVQGAFVEILESEYHPSYLNPILTKNKEEKMIQWYNARTYNLQGEINGSLSIGVDVTDKINDYKNLTRQLEQAKALIAKMLENRNGK
jgi:PAS domain S-box-containing protein